MSSTPRDADSPAAIATANASAVKMPQRGSYQPRPPRPSNASTNVSRYSDSGSTHRKGTDVMFCVMWLVDASNSTEPSAANASHSTYSPAVGAGSSSSSGSGAAN